MGNSKVGSEQLLFLFPLLLHTDLNGSVLCLKAWNLFQRVRERAVTNTLPESLAQGDAFLIICCNERPKPEAVVTPLQMPICWEGQIAHLKRNGNTTTAISHAWWVTEVTTCISSSLIQGFCIGDISPKILLFWRRNLWNLNQNKKNWNYWSPNKNKSANNQQSLSRSPRTSSHRLKDPGWNCFLDAYRVTQRTIHRLKKVL